MIPVTPGGIGQGFEWGFAAGSISEDSAGLSA